MRARTKIDSSRSGERGTLRALIDAALSAERGHPLEGEGAGLRMLPWVACGLLGFSLVPLLPHWGSPAMLAAAALIPAIVLSGLLLPWERLPAWTQAVPPLLPLVALALVRTSQDGPETAYTPVVLLPVIWFALYGTRGQLLLATLGVGIVFAIPTSAIGGNAYPITEPAAAFLWMTISGITGFTLSELVRQRETLEQRLMEIARTDALTGLPNRRAWDEELERELARAARAGTPLCTALLDLDHFKEFNDLHGHPAGDEHLKATAVRWRATLRAGDLIARYGGEEFAVILAGTPMPRALEIVERLRNSVPRGETVSSGVSEWDRSESAAELVARADDALYEAKRRGRDRAVALP